MSKQSEEKPTTVTFDADVYNKLAELKEQHKATSFSELMRILFIKLGE